MFKRIRNRRSSGSECTAVFTLTVWPFDPWGPTDRVPSLFRASDGLYTRYERGTLLSSQAHLRIV